MFYSHFILAKKGPLGTIWIAAHLEAKLRKHQIADTNITTSVDSILFPEVPIALRLSGHLLLGVVRIYSRKVHYLFNDCSEALVKIKQAFQSSAVDLPPEASKVPFHSITLPETFDFDELDFTFKYDSNNQASDYIDVTDHNISARDLITLEEQPHDDGQQLSMYLLDERFPTGADPYALLFGDNEDQPQEGHNATTKSASTLHDDAAATLEEDVLPPFQMEDNMHMENFELFQDPITTGQKATPPVHLSTQGSLFAAGDITPIATASPQSLPEIEKLRAATGQRQATPLFMEFEEEFLPPTTSDKQERMNTNENASDGFPLQEIDATPLVQETPRLHRPSPSIVDDFENYIGQNDVLGDILGGSRPNLKVRSTPQEVAPPKRARKKRKIFDGKQIIASLLMKKQLADTSDLCRKRQRNPSSEFELWRLQGSYHDHMFERPSFNGSNTALTELYNHILKIGNVESISEQRTRRNTASASEDRVQESSMGDIDGAMDNSRCPASTHRAPTEGTPMQPEQFSPVDIGNYGHENMDLQDGTINRPFDGADNLYVDLIIRPETELAERNEVGNLSPAEDFEVSTRNNDDRCDGDVSGPGHFQELDEGRCDDAERTMSPTSETIPEKLDFLEDTREKALYDGTNGDTFLEDADLYNRKKGKPNHVYAQNGWSGRTKAVAGYLKSIFEKVEHSSSSGLQQSAEICLDELLRGRTRKEAARMYFEILVLKSKDYLHVEQPSAFAEIKLSATSVLRKEVF